MTINASGPRTQLWKEEYDILSGLARAVPDNGTIVEIGTAEGGTALLMHGKVKGRGVQIYTVDVAPSPRAFEYLQDTDVQIVPQASESYARTWQSAIRRPIDLLFIDGNHDLEHVVGDWNAWAPFVRRGGFVAFHDYDPPERGGLVHFAVRVGVETVLGNRLLKDPLHRFKIGYGAIDRPERLGVDAQACYETVTAIGARITAIRDADYSGACIVAEPNLGTLLRGCLRAERGFNLISPGAVQDLAAQDAQTHFVVSAQPDVTALSVLRERFPEAKITLLDSLTLCCLVAGGLRSNYAYLAQHTRALNEFLFWAETYFMFEYGFGEFSFPDKIPASPYCSDLQQLSRLVAREQARLVILARVLRTFLEWIP